MWNFLETYRGASLQCIAGYAIEKEIERLQQKNVNVAIKRVKSNAPALALSSDSNIDKVKARKSFKEHTFAYPKRGIFRSRLHIFCVEVAFSLGVFVFTLCV